MSGSRCDWTGCVNEGPLRRRTKERDDAEALLDEALTALEGLWAANDRGDIDLDVHVEDDDGAECPGDDTCECPARAVCKALSDVHNKIKAALVGAKRGGT